MYRDEMLVRLAKGEDSLELAIEKWEDLVKHLDSIGGYDDYDNNLESGNDNCALCETHSHCCGCPVAQNSGYTNCFQTPFYDYEDAAEVGDLDAMRDAAKRELEFLKGLRKKWV